MSVKALDEVRPENPSEDLLSGRGEI